MKHCTTNPPFFWLTSMPSDCQLYPNSIYIVRIGDSVKLYVTDRRSILRLVGTAENSQGEVIINSPNNSISIQLSGQTFSIDVSTTLLNAISAALKTGDNISLLSNDAGYVTNSEMVSLLDTKFDKPTGTDQDYLDGQGNPQPFPEISGVTNLSYSAAPTQGIVQSDTGTGAIIPLADNINAGLITAEEKAKITTTFQNPATSNLDMQGFDLEDVGTINGQPFPQAIPITSVNGEVGDVVLDADDISDSGTTHKFTDAASITKLAGIATGATANQSDATTNAAIALKENSSNKQNSLTPDGTGVKFLTVDAANNGLQPLDSDLTAISALTTDTFGRGVLTQTSAANARTYIGAEPIQSGTGFLRKTGTTTSYVNIVPTTQGGTGLSTIGTANQILQVNPAGTALIYATNSTASNTIVNQASLPIIRTSNNISDNSSFIQAGFYQTDGVYVNVTNHLSLNKQPIVNLNPKTISGLGTIGNTAARILFYDASNALISVLSGAPYTSAAPFTFTPPAGTVTFAVTIVNQTGVGTSPSTSPYKNTVMISEGTEILPFETFGNTYVEPKKAFVSLSGNDTTGDGTLGKPFRTISKANSILYWSGGEILMRGGDYPSENTNVLSYRNIKLSAYGSEVVRILNGIKVTSGTLEGGYTKVYKTTGITLPPGTLEVWQHDINDAATAITNADRHPIHKNKTHRLSSTKMVKAASLADIEASTVLKWFNIGTDFYFSKTTGSDLTVNPIVIPDQTIYIRQASVENINFQYGGLFFTNLTTDTYLKNVSSKFSNSTCFLVGGSANTASITFENCEAAASHEDGFGLGGNARVKEINSYSHDHFDEGSSAHDDVNIERYDCYYEWNGTGAIADVGNSHSLISGCTARYGNSDIIFSHSAIGGVDTGIGIIQNTTTSGAITASVAGRVRVYNSSATNGFNSNVTAIGTMSLTATANLNFPNVLMNQNAVLTVTVTGATVGDAVVLGLPNSLLTGLTYNVGFLAWVSATNTVSVRFQNNDPMAAHDFAAADFKITVLK